ncbi:unnamed protein product [Closterium sp. Yama58-4]|nr:unnamed protein product [Closterium sp. Yama58-4]
MATEAEKSAVDQGHTAESAIAPPPAPAADVAVAAAPPLPLAPPAVVATSAVPLPLSPAPPPSLPHAVPVSGAPVPVAQPMPGAQPPARAVPGGPALGTAVGVGLDSAPLVAPSAAPVNPVAQQPAESQMPAAAGGNAAAHRGRGSPRRRPSSSYRSAHRGGRGSWWGGHGRGRGGPSEMQQLREDFPGMLAAAMRNALNGAPNLGSSPAPAAPAPAPAPVNAQVLAAPLAAPAPHASAYPRAPAPGGLASRSFHQLLPSAFLFLLPITLSSLPLPSPFQPPPSPPSPFPLTSVSPPYSLSFFASSLLTLPRVCCLVLSTPHHPFHSSAAFSTHPFQSPPSSPSPFPLTSISPPYSLSFFPTHLPSLLSLLFPFSPACSSSALCFPLPSPHLHLFQPYPSPFSSLPPLSLPQFPPHLPPPPLSPLPPPP